MLSYRIPETGQRGDKSVFVLRDTLKSLGYSVFLGESSIQSGDDWPTVIQTGVEECRAFVAVCSHTYGDMAVSKWTKRELERADKLGKPLFTVWNSGIYPPKPVAMVLQSVQYVPNDATVTEGYDKAGISHVQVAQYLAAALARAKIKPSAPRSGAAARAKPSTVLMPVPDDVAAFLAELKLSQYGSALVSELGMSVVSDFALLEEQDLQQVGMTMLERRMLLAAAGRAAPTVHTRVQESQVFDVVLSYRLSDTGENGDMSVFTLRRVLESRGFSVFAAEMDLYEDSTRSWPSVIQAAIEGCRAFVVLCSSTYDDSSWCERELMLADYLKKRIFPVWHSGPYPPRAVEIYLSGMPRIPAGAFEEGYARARIPHQQVAEELAAALVLAGVTPSSRPWDAD